MPYELNDGLYPFPLTNLASSGGTVATVYTEGDVDATLETDNWYVLCLDADDFNDWLSVIMVGAPIAFPDGYNKIIQQFMQLREFPNEIPSGSCMDLCQLILDCIESDAGIQQAIAAFGVTSPIAVNAPEVQANLDAELINDPVGCDNDIIFGQCTGLADLLNQISEDMLEIFIQAASPAGRIGDMIEAIPGIGELPVDDIFQFVESVMDDINSGYEAAYTAQVRDDIRCGFFCIAQDNCELTLEQARDFIITQIVETFTFDAWDDFLDDVIENAYSGVQTVWIMHLIILEAIIFGGQIVGYDTNRIVQIILAMLNDPDADWSTLCTDCAWTGAWLNGDGDPDVDNWVTDLGTWQSGADEITEGVRTGSTNGVSVCVVVGSGESGFIDEITMGYDVDSNTGRNQRIRLFDGDDVLIFEELIFITGTDVDTLVWTGHQAFAEDDYFILTTARSTPASGHATMTIMNVKGSGDNPFVT